MSNSTKDLLITIAIGAAAYLVALRESEPFQLRVTIFFAIGFLMYVVFAVKRASVALFGLQQEKIAGLEKSISLLSQRLSKLELELELD